MTELDLDELIRDAVRAEMENSPGPSLTSAQAWEQLNKHLQQRKKENSKNMSWPIFKSKFVYIASIAIVVFMVLWNPVNSAAFGKLTEIIQQVQGAFVQLFVRVDVPQDGTTPSEDYILFDQSKINSEIMSLEEAQKNTSFDIRVPSYIPAGYQLNSVIVIKRENQKSDEIYLQFENDNSSFLISEKIIKDSSGTAVVADYEDTIREQMIINNQLANLVTYKDGTIELIWVVSDYYYYEIKGQLSRDEIIAIAESLS
jgi:hypothetical protein